jgi:hypothetical protein
MAQASSWAAGAHPQASRHVVHLIRVDRGEPQQARRAAIIRGGARAPRRVLDDRDRRQPLVGACASRPDAAQLRDESTIEGADTSL